jgi:hypothetical protein
MNQNQHNQGSDRSREIRQERADKLERKKKDVEYHERNVRHLSSIITYFESIVPRSAHSLKDPCSICLDDITKLSITPCGHLYCNDCIIEAVRATGRCPECNEELTVDQLSRCQTEAEKVTIENKYRMERLVKSYGTKMAHLITFLVQTIRDSAEHRIIVFSQFDRMLEKIGSTLVSCDIPVVYCKGNVHMRNKAIRDFQTSADGKRVMMLSLDRAASGTNLTMASHVVLIEPVAGTKEEALATEGQAIGRAHRQGQTKELHVLRLIMRDTIEHELHRRNFGDSEAELRLQKRLRDAEAAKAKKAESAAANSEVVGGGDDDVRGLDEDDDDDDRSGDGDSSMPSASPASSNASSRKRRRKRDDDDDDDDYSDEERPAKRAKKSKQSRNGDGDGDESDEDSDEPIGSMRKKGKGASSSSSSSGPACPVCSVAFPDGASDVQMSEHVEVCLANGGAAANGQGGGGGGAACPVCQTSFNSSMTTAAQQAHVEQCLDNANDANEEKARVLAAAEEEAAEKEKADLEAAAAAAAPKKMTAAEAALAEAEEVKRKEQDAELQRRMRMADERKAEEARRAQAQREASDRHRFSRSIFRCIGEGKNFSAQVGGA